VKKITQESLISDLNEPDKSLVSFLSKQLQMKISSESREDIKSPSIRIFKGHVTSLSLKNLKLKNLPEIVGDFPRLFTLDLQDNFISRINLGSPDSFPKLRTLILKDNNLTSFDFSSLKSLHNLSFLDLSNNSLTHVDLSPLSSLQRLEYLILDNNEIRSIDLKPLNTVQTLVDIGLSGNPLRELDITPILTIPTIDILDINDRVTLTAKPIKRDKSFTVTPFLVEHIPRIEWQLETDDLEVAKIYKHYSDIVRNFRHDEFWADFQERRMQFKDQKPESVTFFDFLVTTYLKIKSNYRTPTYNPSCEKRDIRTKTRKKIAQEIDSRYFPLPELYPLLRDYWIPGNEPSMAIELINGSISNGFEIRIFQYWTAYALGLHRVHSVSWMRIQEAPEQIYEVTLGFNDGWIRNGTKYHPDPVPETFPPDVFKSVEAMYTIEKFTTSNPLDLITRGHDWLSHSYSPSFDPRWPESYQTNISRGSL